MRTDLSHLEAGRTEGPAGADYGAFMLRDKSGDTLCVIVSQGDLTGWEHVSVHARRKHRGKVELYTPTWDQMSYVKDMLWTPEEAVMQLHPAKSEHINVHPHVLHLWRPLSASIPLPPKILV